MGQIQELLDYAAPSPPPEKSGGEGTAAAAILLELALLALAFVIGRFLERKRINWIGEAGAALLLGLLAGLVLRAAGAGDEFDAKMAFRADLFFYVLLPTIMFDAGYCLDPALLIRHAGSVSAYAFLGTTISCFVIALMMWGFGAAGWCYRMGLLYNLCFGALISATHPGLVLAVLQRLGAAPDLYINVFGESVLNGAVGMVLFTVMDAFATGARRVTPGNVVLGVLLFCGIFLGSMAVGLAVGLLAAYIFRSRFYHFSDGSSPFEVGLVVVFAYGAYLMADVARLSGMVAVLFAGMAMQAYVAPNLSASARGKTPVVLKVLAGLFELFVFQYIGLTAFLVKEHFNISRFLVLSLVALAVSRAANVYPCTWLVNAFRPPERQVSQPAAFVLWWSGLRGVMAFALAVRAAEAYGEPGEVMQSCTLLLVLISVLINGAGTAALLKKYNLLAETPTDGHGAPGQAAHGVAGGSGGYTPSEDVADERAPFLGAAPQSTSVASLCGFGFEVPLAVYGSLGAEDGKHANALSHAASGVPSSLPPGPGASPAAFVAAATAELGSVAVAMPVQAQAQPQGSTDMGLARSPSAAAALASLTLGSVGRGLSTLRRFDLESALEGINQRLTKVLIHPEAQAQAAAAAAASQGGSPLPGHPHDASDR